jgi:hypothetical protein
LGYRKLDDWYQISNRQLIERGGHGLAKRVHYSLPAVLKDYRPAYRWQEWRLTTVPDGFWEARRNRRRYWEWVGQQLDYRHTEDWYQTHMAADRSASRLASARQVWQLPLSGAQRLSAPVRLEGVVVCTATAAVLDARGESAPVLGLVG